MNLLGTTTGASSLLDLPRITVAFRCIETDRCRRKEKIHQHRIVKHWRWRRPQPSIGWLECCRWRWQLQLWIENWVEAMSKALIHWRQGRECPLWIAALCRADAVNRHARDHGVKISGLLAVHRRIQVRERIVVRRKLSPSSSSPTSPLLRLLALLLLPFGFSLSHPLVNTGKSLFFFSHSWFFVCCFICRSALCYCLILLPLC